MTGILLLLTFAYLMFSAVMHDKTSDNKRLKDWGFWVIEVVLFILGIGSLNDSDPAHLFVVFMLIVLCGILEWRVGDRKKKNLKGGAKAIHIIITLIMCLIWFAVGGSITNALTTPTKYDVIHTKHGDKIVVNKDNQ